MAYSQTEKPTAIKRTAVRETSVPRHHGGGIESPSEAPRTITALSYWTAVVLNLAGGTEPHKFHICIHRTLRSCKNEMCVVNVIYFLLLLLKISCRRIPETDSPNPWGSIEPWLRITALKPSVQ